MKKNITKYITLALIFSIPFVSCETIDFNDVNKNTNGPSDPYPAGLLSGAIMTYATQTGRTGLMNPTLYVQYQSQVTYTDEMLYSEVPISWFAYYNNVLHPLSTIIDYLGDETNHTTTVLAQGSVENQIGVSMILRAVAMKRVTDTWGDAPFSEAFQGADNLTPVYDSQEDIYTALIEEVKAGRDMLNASTTAPTGDIIYDGDINKWKKFANSFLLQMAIQLSEVYPNSGEFAASTFNEALGHSAGVIETVTDEAWFQFEDIEGFRNPWNANRTPDYFLSQEFTDALKGNGALNPTSNTVYDDRISVYADDSSLDGVPYGYNDGSGAGAASVSNDNYWNNTTPLPLMTASYVALNRAEASARNWTSENANALLQEGIEKSYETLDARFGTSISSAASSYAASRVSDAGSVSGGILQVIGEEKWVSLFGQGFVSWAEWRRTDYPSLTPATDYINAGDIPTRYLYPIEEQTLNGSNYDAAVSRLSSGQDKNTANVWWDK